MKYFSLFTILGICCSIELNAMNFGRVDSGNNQQISTGQQDTRTYQPRLQLRITPYKDLSDAMQAEEHLVANLQTMCNSYMCVLNTRRALLDNSADIRVIKEYDDSIDAFWSGINNIMYHISGSRHCVKYLTSIQYVMAGVPDSFLVAQHVNNQNQQHANTSNIQNGLCMNHPVGQN